MKITDSAEFGKVLRNRRKQLGLTQGYIAEVTGCSISFLSDLERGKPTAELGKSLYIANMLGLDLEITARGE